MPSLTPAELQVARVQSGRLGGRPRKPTQAEARDRVLEELLPDSILALKKHLDGGDPSSWRAALRVLELVVPRAAEPDEQSVALPETAHEIAALGWRELQLLAARILVEPSHASDDQALPVGRPLK
jgi:hypothetical protein